MRSRSLKVEVVVMKREGAARDSGRVAPVFYPFGCRAEEAFFPVVGLVWWGICKVFKLQVTTRGDVLMYFV